MAGAVEWLLGVLRGMTAAQYGGLEAFAEVRKSWNWALPNWPPVGVLPGRSEFDAGIVGAKQSRNHITIRFGLNSEDPDEATAMAIAYMLAIDAAIYQADEATPCANSKWLFIVDHDYGPLYGKDGKFAYFPEMHLYMDLVEPLAPGADA
jgi:hypothetical protein